MSDLKVCKRCGWHALMGHDERCHPVAGVRADDLIATLDDIDSTKLGYGDRCLVFEPERHGADRLHVRFEVSDSAQEEQPFRLREVWLLDSLSREEAASLTRAIVNWRAKVLADRRTP